MVEENKMYYIAAPYWHPSEQVRNERRNQVIAYSMMLTRRGILNYSPLLYTERFKKTAVPESFWLEHGLRMVDACDVVRVLCLDGWKDSSGIAGEVKRAESQGKKVEYVERYKRLAFCGSRTCNDQHTIDLIHQAIEMHQPETIITHGEPEGVCTLAQKVAKELGLPLKVHFLQLKRAAGKFHHRSRAVFEDCDYCVFIHDGVSTGCSNEIEMAKKMGIAYEYHLHDGTGKSVDDMGINFDELTI
jgi:hypothetical protein